METFKRGAAPEKPNTNHGGHKRNQVQVTLRLVPSVKAALDRACKEEDKSKNLMVNEILATHFDLSV